jgi:nucleotide-binding universal stress UspA family protein
MKAVDVRTRIQLKNIIYATDFSATANAAAPYAVELTKHYGAKLYALHVRPPAVNPMTPPESWKSLEEAAEIEAEQARRKILDAFAEIQPQVLIKEGDLWSNLAAAIKENKIDLVIVGTRGRSGVRKFLLGSAAEAIFRQAPCPVLTIGPHSVSEPKRSGEFIRILFATDFSSESTAAAAYAISLAQEYQARLTLLHVLAEPKTGDLVQPSDLEASSRQILHNLVPPEAELWCVPDYVVERGAVAETILQVAGERATDLIVLGVRQPHGFPGAVTHLPMATAHKIVSRANCAVLTVRA